jgi:hypothetical protein
MRRDVLFVLVISGLGLALAVASAAHAADANLRLVQAPSPRREIDLGEIRPSDSPRCRQAKQDVKVLDGRLNSAEFSDIPTQSEYDLGERWQRPGGASLSVLQTSTKTGREQTLETWGENSRQFKDGETAYAKYVDFTRRAPKTYSKPAEPQYRGGNFADYMRQLDEWKKVPSYTYATPESERLWKAFEQKINIQRARKATYDSMLSICYPTPDPLQDLEERVRRLEEKTPGDK